MITAASFIEAARREGFRFYFGVPCSYLTAFINYVINSGDLRYVGAANEGDAVAMAAGAALGGSPGVCMLQNSGLGNAVSPLTSLTWPFCIPVLLITTLRGEPGGAPDEPQHRLMGAITTRLLETMEIPWEYFPDEEGVIEEALGRAVAHMRVQLRPYALVMRKGTVSPHELASVMPARAPDAAALPPEAPSVPRRAMLEVIRAAAGRDDVLIAGTGYCGRELYALGDADNQFYMVGSMGCAASLGLGLALAQPDRRVIVIDGDGGALMRLGAFATVGHERPGNLVHVVLDNGVHESTGGQATVSGSTDFCAIAAACGYASVARASTPDAVTALLGNRETPAFIHVPITPGTPQALPRPDVTPDAVARRLQAFVGSSA